MVESELGKYTTLLKSAAVCAGRVNYLIELSVFMHRTRIWHDILDVFDIFVCN